jgi:hypothetical protein
MKPASGRLNFRMRTVGDDRSRTRLRYGSSAGTDRDPQAPVWRPDVPSVRRLLRWQLADVCYPRGEFRVGEHDVLLGHLDGQPFYIGGAQYEYWKHTKLIIDAVDGRGGMFSLEGSAGSALLDALALVRRMGTCRAWSTGSGAGGRLRHRVGTRSVSPPTMRACAIRTRRLPQSADSSEDAPFLSCPSDAPGRRNDIDQGQSSVKLPR